MGIPNAMNTGKTALFAAKAAMSTAGHNIANAGTEGYTRQRVETKTQPPDPGIGSSGQMGRGVLLSSVDRIHDSYLEKQLREGGKRQANHEEKDFILSQVQDVFNELDGEGLNRVVGRFFNEFRKLSNDPNSEAVRQSVRESSKALVTDIQRLRNQVKTIESQIDSRLEGYAAQVNSAAREVRDLNQKIIEATAGGTTANDLMDSRDRAMKRLAEFMDVHMHLSEDGAYNVDVVGMGPLVTGPNAETFEVFRSGANSETGKSEGSYDLGASGSASNSVTHQVSGGRIGGLIEVRDEVLSNLTGKLDEIAFRVSKYVNQIHREGFTKAGFKGVNFFKDLKTVDRAAEYMDLSDEIKGNVNNIASAAIADAPGDNRIALAISGLQHMNLMNDGKTTVDDFYNSIISEVGVKAARNKEAFTQQKTVVGQLEAMRDRISGVSLDEETANIMEYQQVYDASARVINVADEMLRTVLSIGT